MDIKRIAQPSEFAQQLETNETKAPETPALPKTLDPTNVVEKFEKGDEVLVAFQHGDIAQPLVVGDLWKGDTPPTEADVRNTVSSALNGESPVGDLLQVMIEYQKMMNKENREDKKIPRADQRFDLTLQDAELDREKEKIGQAQQESTQKFNNAFDEASYEMLLGAFSAMQQADHSEQLNQMGQRLDQLRAAKSGLISEMNHNQNQGSVTISLIEDWIRHHKP
ncbi:MAG TPA: hypothetical protein VFG11_09195 [Acidobacteriota bacterium]|nr:hypothetical protein [Acidobacteriota bacterium]